MSAPKRPMGGKGKGKRKPGRRLTPSEKDRVFVGEWADIEEWLGELPRELILAGDQITHTLAVVVATAVSETIARQGYRHIKLNEGYRQSKIKKGLDERILIATGTYLAAIQARRSENGDWSAGLPDAIHEPSGLNFQDLWNILEFGSDDFVIPGRPHFLIELARMNKHMKKAIKDNGFIYLGRV